MAIQINDYIFGSLMQNDAELLMVSYVTLVVSYLTKEYLIESFIELTLGQVP